MNISAMLKKEIQVRTNLLTILIICILLIVVVVIRLTNSVQNLMFATISAGQVDTITIHEQYGERNATLSEIDVRALSALLQNVRLLGRSARLIEAENMNPQYTVQLKNDIQFDIACYADHYIINGRGYAVKDSHYNNYTAIGQQYMEFLENRDYFPREADRGDLS